MINSKFIKKHLIALSLVLIASNTYAHKDINDDLGFWPVDENDIQSAICRYPVAKNSNEINDYFKKLTWNDKKIEKKNIFGVTFTNESSNLLYLFYKLTETASNTEEPQPERQINLAHKFPEITKCDKVLCATSVIFGASESLKTLYLLSKFKLNTSYIRYTDAAKMYDQELSDIIYALSYLPADMVTVSSNQKLIRYLRDPQLEANKLRPIMNHTMTIFKRWDEFKTISKAKIVLHEYAHIWSQEGGIDKFSSKKWLDLSRWEPAEKEDTFTSDLLPSKKPNTAWVSEYAQRHPAEDFAEAVTAYRLVPEYLLQISPGKYEFIKTHVFNGREFRKTSDCDNKDLLTQRLFGDIVNNAKGLAHKNKESIQYQCFENTEVSEKDKYSCLISEVIKSYFNERKGQYGEDEFTSTGLIPYGFFDPVTAKPKYNHPVFKEILQTYFQ